MPRWLKEAPPPGPEPKLSPDVKANIISQTLFSWCFPILKIGYSRPLEAGGTYAAMLARSFRSRVADTPLLLSAISDPSPPMADMYRLDQDRLAVTMGDRLEQVRGPLPVYM